MSETPSLSAHLLLLPRELRDRIYTHLTQTLDFTWHRDNISAPHSNPADIRPAEHVPVRFPASPLPHVFLIHPQITAEYTQTCLSNLEAVLDPALPFSPQEAWDSKWDVQVLRRVRHVTLFVQLHARSTAQSLDWGDQLALLGDVAAHTPGLATLRVAVRQQFLGEGPRVPDEQLDGVLKTFSTRKTAALGGLEFLPEMPRVVGGLEMVQRGEGLHVGYKGIAINERGRNMRHGVKKVGVYMYVRGGERWERRVWRVEEVVGRWPMRAYEESVREVVGEERAAWLMGLPWGIAEWVEVMGGTVKR
ncbi:hypothetical protein P171DRAFT_183083 [Karstenula rhodostoma CBS 690.94]|uniref:Uncharacterized protein n=1 Tax=Karstenula rhodostoma CBS 690.94 TaxID=1392251 RepID=A0A9P4U5Y3_9PLEO|nr:hypothetical protein P171DRAFT_183083 [Karstenula rhodostoma CBS 690.94]